ncbi:MAG TPA: flagellar biosynthesis protein FlhF [Clostridiales bacterium]|nr:flagellar biosynthesis protein FlhF [Clostridiales bacterium]
MMKIKRYIGDSVQDAYQKVKVELGKDAVIINTRKIRRKGIKGFFSKPIIEVVAAVDDYKDIKINDFNYESDTRKSQKNEINYIAGKRSFQEELSFSNYKKLSDIDMEFNEIKSMLNKVYKVIKADEINLSEICREYINRLRSEEIDERIIEKIINKIEKLTVDLQNNENFIRDFIYNLLSDYITIEDEDLDNPNNRVIVFAGPTGVGKTTTMAKLAALYSLKLNKKVGFITSDTYRIAAVEQLKTYSDIIGIPLTVIYSPQEFKNAVENYSDKDIIMVDTAGRSHNDKYQLMELKHLLNSDTKTQVYLVISAGTKMKDCYDILESYGFLDDYRLLFTKLDETSTHGIIINTSFYTKKPLSYLTYGQNVPDDIEKADKSKIINSLLGDKIYERPSS